MLSSNSQSQFSAFEAVRHAVVDDRTPLVSIVIPAFNAAEYIGECLASALAQSFEDFEVIVINDGSRDTEALERVLAPYRLRINYMKQENRGPSAARNTGIKSARGQFIAFLDADDSWLPNYLAEQMQAFEDDPTLDLIYADALLQDGRTANAKSFMDAFPSRGPVTVEALLEQRCVVITSCVVIRKKALLDAGLFDENYFRSEDFDLWVRLAHRGAKLGCQRKILARHRLRADSLAADPARMNKSATEVYENLAHKLELTPSQLRLIETQIAKYQASLALAEGKSALAAGNHEQAYKSLSRARDLQKQFGREDLKLSLVLSCLQLAPRAFQRVYQLRERLAPSP